jgi:hypothetical protein
MQDEVKQMQPERQISRRTGQRFRMGVRLPSTSVLHTWYNSPGSDSPKQTDTPPTNTHAQRGFVPLPTPPLPSPWRYPRTAVRRPATGPRSAASRPSARTSTPALCPSTMYRGQGGRYKAQRRATRGLGPCTPPQRTASPGVRAGPVSMARAGS